MGERPWSRGPWRIEHVQASQGDTDDSHHIASPEMVVCGWWTWHGDRPKREANARLIAAAPDLFEEGEQAAVQLEEAANLLAHAGLTSLAENIIRPQVARLRAALSKALPPESP